MVTRCYGGNTPKMQPKPYFVKISRYVTFSEKEVCKIAPCKKLPKCQIAQLSKIAQMSKKFAKSGHT
jgi:hypothetical protein